MTLFDSILKARGLTGHEGRDFLSPNYAKLHDPMLLPDMQKAIDRLMKAHKNQEKVVIYGDYDIDGLTATTLLVDAFDKFGFKHVDVFIPNRFTDGYGLTEEAVRDICEDGTDLIVTVDSGSSSINEVKLAADLGVDVIVTDHHIILDGLPEAVAVINPKRDDNKYPFTDLPGVGVAFKLVTAMQRKMPGIDPGHEKWLLDLVSLGTVCDVVNLTDENRIFAFFGLQVLAKTRRPGLKALMAVSGIDRNMVNARSLGFGLGPRLNAAGRLDTAKYALELLTEKNPLKALAAAEKLDAMNKGRRKEQDQIVREAIIQAKHFGKDSVLVLSDSNWNQGIVGIAAAKILEKFSKPTFVLQQIGEETKGSARSFGDFSAVEGINSCRDLISRGGGHKLAAGITLPTKNIDQFRVKINQYYDGLRLSDQSGFLRPVEDVGAGLGEINEQLYEDISKLEPFGMGNPEPVIKSEGLMVDEVKKMGDDNQHVKLTLVDQNGHRMQFIAFGAPGHYFVNPGETVDVWYNLTINEWRGKRAIEGRIVDLIVNSEA